MARSNKRKLGGGEHGMRPEAAAPDATPEAVATSGPRRRARAVLVVMALAPWALVLWLAARPTHAPGAALRGEVAVRGGATWKAGRPGPWGTLERYEITIEPPEADVTADLCDEQPARWVFPEQTRGEVLALLDEARLDGAMRASLVARLRCAASGPGCTIEPPLAALLGMSPEARSTIYGVLTHYPENQSYQYGFRRRADDPGTWFAGSRLSPRGEGVLRRLMWSHAGIYVFSNLGAACSQLDPDDKAPAVRAIARTPALLVRLRVEPTADVDALTDYWGPGVFRKRVRTLLESLRAARGDSTLDIVHLLPPLVRERLYTYPAPGDPPWDCHWTSTNFHERTPSDRYLDLTQVRAHLAAAFREVPFTERRLGDILTYNLNDRVVIHSAVYIADDIVFTKNGGTSLAPWILMSLEDVGAIYAPDDHYRIRVYRQR